MKALRKLYCWFTTHKWPSDLGRMPTNEQLDQGIEGFYEYLESALTCKRCGYTYPVREKYKI